MEVVVDGIIYQLQANGGISRLFSEILPRMCDMDESLHITLLTAGQLRRVLPAHSQISHRSIPQIERYLRPGRLWKPIVPRAKELVRKLWIGRGQGRIWHSTYYTQPEHWDGAQVVTVVDMIYERFSNLFAQPFDEQFRVQKRRCVSAADVVICISETTRHDVQQIYGISSEKTQVVPLAPSAIFRVLEDRNSLVKVRTVGPFLLYVGDRAHYKNFDGLLKAYSVWSRQEEVTLLVVGKQWSTDEEKRLAELGIRDRVHLLTCVDDEALCQLYNQAAALVYPSLYEGFGIPILEAMACGCPVVASRIPSTLEVVGDCPIYFDSTQVDDLIIALDRVLEEGRDSARCQAGLQRVKHFSWGKTASKTLDVYRAITTRSSRL